MQRSVRSLIVLPLTLQIALGSSLALAQSRPPSTSSIVANHGQSELPRSFEEAISELESAPEGALPGAGRDAFHLTGHVLEITTGPRKGTYSLSNPNLNLPSVVAPDFDRDVQVRIDPLSGRVALELSVKGEVLARHILPDSVRGVAFARDKELMTVMSPSGEVYALDIGYARSQAFSAPLPMVQLLDTHIQSQPGDGVATSFLSRGLKPIEVDSFPTNAILPLDRNARVQADPGDPLVAGDLLIYRDTPQGRKFLGLLDRSVIKTQLYSAEAIVAMLAFQVSPPTDADTALASLAKLHQEADVRKQSADQSTNLGDLVREALTVLPEKAVQSLLTRAKINKGDVGQKRDRFTLAEWADQFERLQAHAAQGIERDKKVNHETQARIRDGLMRGDFGSDWRTIVQSAQRPGQESSLIPRVLFHRFMSSKSMRSLALVTAGGVALHAIDVNLVGGQGTAWAVHFANQIYDNYIPDVVRDESYRVTLLKSSFYLSAFVPLLWSVGLLSSKALKVPWSAVKSVAAGGMRAYAQMMLPFYHRVARLARQPNFMKALQLGVSPLARVRADSALGQSIGLQEDVRPGVNNPFVFGEAHQTAVEAKSKVLSALSEQDRRRRALAWTLALLVASEQSEMDPATLSAMIQNGDSEAAQEQLESLAANPEFQKKWASIAQELHFNIRKLNDGKIIEDLSSISMDELSTYYKAARETADRIQSRGRVAKVAASMRNKWRRVVSGAVPAIASFGLPEYEFLKSAEPSGFVVSQFWKQFVVDYLLSVGQVGLIGDRANLHDPQALAAQEGSFLATSPGHRFDMIDQVRIYGINLPARMALVYQTVLPVTEDAYDPIERDSLVGTENQDSLVNGLKRWFMGAGNLVEADYGGIWLRSLSRSVKTIQANLIMAVVARVVFGGQGLEDAIPAFAFGMIWGLWQFGWVWEPINRGNQMYQDKLDALRAKFMDAKDSLGQAIRLGDSHAIATSARDLANLYNSGDNSLLPTDISSALEDLEALVANVPTSELAALQRRLSQTREVMSELERALQEGDLARIASAKEKLVAMQSEGASDAAALVRLNGLSLLEYSMRNPPFATKASKWLAWFTVGFGAVLTTYWATSMSVDSFRPDISWSEKLLEATIWSATLYTGVYYGQKALSYVVKNRSGIVDQAKNLATNAVARIRKKPPTCEAVFSAR